MPRVWKREDLVAVLGPPSREGNNAEEYFLTEEGGKRTLHIGARVVGPNESAPPRIKGVGRWLMWDCYQFERASREYRKFLKELIKDDAAALGGKGVFENADASIRDVFAMFRSLHCLAHSRETDDGTEKWVLYRTCPKHSNLK